jgi:hypothetical protein
MASRSRGPIRPSSAENFPPSSIRGRRECRAPDRARSEKCREETHAAANGNDSTTHFPKFVIRLNNHFSRTSESNGYWQAYDSSTAFRSEVRGMNSPLAIRELQIGGARAIVAPTKSTKRRACNGHASALARSFGSLFTDLEAPDRKLSRARARCRRRTQRGASDRNRAERFRQWRNYFMRRPDDPSASI